MSACPAVSDTNRILYMRLHRMRMQENERERERESERERDDIPLLLILRCRDLLVFHFVR